jgi:hypothetical protein
LLILAAFAGCDGAIADRTCDVSVPDFRELSQNGANLNGASLNGTSFNGTNLNGANLNGVSLNGTSFNGTNLKGVGTQGTALHGTAADGSPIVGQAWVGTTLRGEIGGAEVTLRVAAVETDADDPSLEWYMLEHDGVPLCGGSGRGLFLAGVWDETGARRDVLPDQPEFAYSFACEHGALAKCVTWGYAPAVVGADAHQSCTRMVRADYCGNGESHTADGTLIDVFDTLDVQHSDASVELEFEAGWGPDGALCVSRPRYTEFGDGEERPVSCWDELPACDDADQALAAGAKLMNRSAPQTLCHG